MSNVKLTENSLSVFGPMGTLNSTPITGNRTMNLIYKKMSQVMADIGSISKDNVNTAQGFKFRGVDNFVNALYPALVKHGVFLAPKVVEASHEVREIIRDGKAARYDKHVHLMVEYTFYAEDGSSVTVGPIAAEGLDSGDKATNKALSAALKYALIQTFSVPTEDMVDADLTSPTIEGGKKTVVSAPEIKAEDKAKTSFRFKRNPQNASAEGKNNG